MSKNCKTCAHLSGSFGEDGMCMKSGYLATSERQNPNVCGENFEAWCPKPGVLKRIRIYFNGAAHE